MAKARERVNTTGLPNAERHRPKLPSREAHSRRGRPQKTLSYWVGGVASFVLVLSVWECTAALSAMTGMNAGLALLLAIGIDAGMVVCECAYVVSPRGTDAHTWAERYIGLSVALSVALNATTAASHASGWWTLAAGAVGGSIPVLVYSGGRVAAGLYTGK